MYFDFIAICSQKYTEAARKRRRRRIQLYVEEPMTQPTKVDEWMRIGIKSWPVMSDGSGRGLQTRRVNNEMFSSVRFWNRSRKFIIRILVVGNIEYFCLKAVKH